MIILLILSIVLVGMVFVQEYLIPRLNPENRFVKWWKNHIVDDDPDHL